MLFTAETVPRSGKYCVGGVLSKKVDQSECDLALILAVQVNDLDIAKCLLAHGANPNTEGRLTCETPLLQAICRFNLDMINLLVNSGANPCMIANGFKTPLAILFSHNEMLGRHTGLSYDEQKHLIFLMGEFLLRHGADPNESGSSDILLILAYDRQYYELMELLLEYGADVNSQDAWGKTALHYAAEGNNIKYVKFFLDRGARVDIQNIDGKTPATLAAAHQNIRVCQLLSQHRAEPGSESAEKSPAKSSEDDIWAAVEADIDRPKKKAVDKIAGSKIKVTCPNCSASYIVDKALVGKKGRCKKCGQPFVVRA